jgi:hypothetical protein
VTPFSASPSASNTPQNALACGAATKGYVYYPGNSQTASVDLLGNRYLNLTQCDYYNAAVGDHYVTSAFPNGGLFAATPSASNVMKTALSCCGGGNGYTYYSGNSSTDSVDLLGNRFVNLTQCDYYNAAVGDHYVTSAFPNGGPFAAMPDVSNAVEELPKCGAGASGWSYIAGNSYVESVDLLDRTRGKGFVEFSLTAGSASTAATKQTLTLSGPAQAASTNAISSATIAIVK